MEQKTFNAHLNENAELFLKIKNDTPSWWNKLLSINGVYVEIRKNDIIQLYYEGGRIAKLYISRQKLKATCHYKYLGIENHNKNISYIDCSEQLDKNPDLIIRNIKD